jgi:hypothetical protein
MYSKNVTSLIFLLVIYLSQVFSVSICQKKKIIAKNAEILNFGIWQAS